jgi:hypothetical protein
MKTRYRMIARRKIEASRRLRLRSDPSAALPSSLDDPMEMPSEVLDLATTELPPYKYKKGRP